MTRRTRVGVVSLMGVLIAALLATIVLRTHWSAALIAWSVQNTLGAESVHVEVDRLDWGTLIVQRVDIVAPTTLPGVERLVVDDVRIPLSRETLWSRPDIARIDVSVIDVMLDTTAWPVPTGATPTDSRRLPAPGDWQPDHLEQVLSHANAALSDAPWLPMVSLHVAQLTIASSDPTHQLTAVAELELISTDAHLDVTVDAVISRHGAGSVPSDSASVDARLIAGPAHLSLTVEHPSTEQRPPHTLLALAYNHLPDASAQLRLHAALQPVLDLTTRLWPVGVAEPVALTTLQALASHLREPTQTDLALSLELRPRDRVSFDWELLLSGLQHDAPTVLTAPLRITGAHLVRREVNHPNAATSQQHVSMAVETGQVMLANALELIDIAVQLESNGTTTTLLPAFDQRIAGELQVMAIAAPAWGIAEQHWRNHRLSFLVDSAASVATGDGFALNGQISILEDRLQGPIQITSPAPERWQIDVTIEPLRLDRLALHDLLPLHWPELLHVERGRVGLQASLIGDDQSLSGTADLSLDAVDLIYDRMLVEGAALQAPIHLSPSGSLSIALPALSAKRVNLGVDLHDLVVAGQLDLPVLTDIGRIPATFDLRHAQADFAGGRLTTSPTELIFSEAEIATTLHVDGVELEQLFAMLGDTLPIDGVGTLDGQLPLRLSAQGILVEQGRLQARPPGGRFAYTASTPPPGTAQAGALALRALSDFRFETLVTDVDHDQDGQLVLGIALSGNSPPLGDDQAVALNIVLEQNLPALLASLQLAAGVSDRIEARIREIFQ